jgi:hypothetical protein
LKSTFGIDKKQDAIYSLKSPNSESPRHEPRRSKKENRKKKKPLQEYDSLSTVCLKLAHQPLDQDKLYFYFGHGK